MGNIERAIISNFELAETKDYLDITYILASSVPNLNGALFTEDELERAKKSIMNQPLIIVPDFGNMPTGHSIEDFPKISIGANIIGTHIASEIIEDKKIKHLKVTARMWKIRYPELAEMIVNLHSRGRLTFSMECNYKDFENVGSARALKGVNFIGSAIVDEPANPYSISLEIAKKQSKEDSDMNKDKEKEKEVKKPEGKEKEELCPKCHKPMSECICDDKDKEKAEEEELCPKCHKPLSECECDDEEDEVKKDKDDDKKKKASLEVEVLTDALEKANSRIKELESELAEIKKAEEQAKLEQLKENRFEAMSQYIDFGEGEVESKKEAYAKLDEEVFELLLEVAKSNKKDEREELAGLDSDIKLKLKPERKGYLDGLVK